MKTPPPRERLLTGIIPAAIALLLLLASVIVAAQLTFGAIGASYSHWMIGAAPAVNDSSAIMRMANHIANAFPAMISMGIARAVVMLITFSAGALLLFTTVDYQINRIGGYLAAFIFLGLALMLLFFGAVRFVWDAVIPAVDFLAHVGLGILLVCLAAVLVQVLRQPRWLIWFSVLFAFLLVIHILFMLIAARALQLDVHFLINLAFLFVLGLIAASLAYTYKMLTHLQRE